MGADVEFRVLGPLEVLDGGRPLGLGGAQQRTLLGVLLVHRREVVSVDRLIDELWGEGPPATAAKTVQVYVSRLRKLLGDGVLVTRGRGYELAVGPGRVDIERFDQLASEAGGARERGEHRRAAGLLREALALWRGPPLADFTYQRFAQSEIARLEEAKLGAVEDLIDARLALGEHGALVGELGGLVREHPLRERLRGQLMLALYRCGRQADALQAYQDARRVLTGELGLEPGEPLRTLERSILTHDPTLDLRSRWAGTARSTDRGRRRRGARLIVLGAAALLAAIAAATVQLTGGGHSGLLAAPNSLAAIDVHNNSVVAAVPVGARPGPVAFGAGSLWVANRDDQTISRVDPGSLRTLRTLSLGGPPTAIAVTPRRIWVVRSDPATSAIDVTAINPEFNAVATRLRVGNVVRGDPGAIAAGGGHVWVAPSAGMLTRLDAATGRIAGQLDPNAGPIAIALAPDAVWLADREADSVTRVDPTGLLAPIAVGNGPSAIAVGEGGVWVADSLDDAIVRIDPGTRAVTSTIRVRRSPAGVAVGAGSVWVANSGDGTVSRIDPGTDRVVATIIVGGAPQAVAVADGRAWVSVDAQTLPAGALTPGGGTIRIVSRADVDYMDPALAYVPFSTQLLDATCARLLNYPDEPAPSGSRLTPEVARSLPERSPDGRTYTFTIRPGFRFSPPSNAPVTAQTFKDTIERTLNPRMHSPVAAELADIVGARAYMSGRAANIDGIVARGDSLTIHLLAPAPDFPVRIAQVAFCAVPADTPIDPSGVRVIPSAGPYYVRSYTPGQGIVLERNPNYRGSRPHHFQRIEIAVGIPIARAIAQVTAGATDYTFLTARSLSASGGSAAAVKALAAELAARYGPGSPAAAHGGQRYFVGTQLQLDYFVLNTHRALFSDVRLRQAVNYALDRRALAQQGNGLNPLPERPTDHYLPPGLPGYRDNRVYPPTPNVAKARQLAHGGGRMAVLYTCDACDEQAQIVKNDLGKIGLHVAIKTFPIAALYQRLATPGEPYDLALGGWLPDYPDPAAMLEPLLRDSTIEPTFDDPAYERRLAAAARLSGPKRYLAYGQLDLELARHAAPLAAIGNHLSYDFFSARIGCQTYGFNGIDIAALCIRPKPR